MDLEYTKPEVTDYGDLTDLTARDGFAVTDVPQGTPVPNVTSGELDT